MASAGPVDDEAPPIGWSLPARLVLAAVPASLTVWVLVANVVWSTKAVLAATLALSCAAPAWGLLLVAILAPLGQLIAPAVSYPEFRISEAIVLAFLAGWLARGLPDRRGPRTAAPFAGTLFAVAIVASMVGQAWQLRAYPGELSSVLDRLWHLYFFILDPIGVVDGAPMIEGLGLAVATVMLFRRRPQLAVTLPIALATSASIAALSSVLLWRGIGWTASLARYKLIGYRVSGHVGDVNAAGSYFAMMVCLALGMALRARGRRRAIWLAAAATIGVGLWFSESRSAFGAAGAVLGLAASLAATTRFSGRTRAVVLASVVIAVVGGAALRVRSLEGDPTYRGGGFREQFFQTSVRMIGARPLFGVGVGQYNRISSLFLSPQLAWTYGFENAHNYYLQIGGELGLTGLALFLAWIGAAIALAARALRLAPSDRRTLGVAGGVVAFLITCLTGHPFLVGEVAYSFWMLFGLMTALASSTLLNQATAAAVSGARRGAVQPRWRLAAAVAMLVGSQISTARGAVSPPASRAVDGFYGWETLKDGTRFRWTGAYASLFVPADVTRVEIPIRLPADGRAIKPMGIEVMTGSVDQGRTIVGAAWTIVSLRLPAASPLTRFKRVDVKVDRVWQPALYIAGSADMRPVGVQVGEPRLIRD